MSAGCPLCGAVGAPRQATLGIAQAVAKRSPVEAIRSLLQRAAPQGLTAVELTTALRMSSTTVTARLCELRRRGEVKRSGVRRNVTGRNAHVLVWVPKEEREAVQSPESFRAVVRALDVNGEAVAE